MTPIERVVELVRSTLDETPMAANWGLSGDMLAAALTASTGGEVSEIVWESVQRSTSYAERDGRRRMQITMHGWMRSPEFLLGDEVTVEVTVPVPSAPALSINDSSTTLKVET